MVCWSVIGPLTAWWALAVGNGVPADAPPAIRPTTAISLLPTEDLSEFTTWLKETQREDPHRVFRLTDGQLHITGEGFGYLATRGTYRDYHLVLEYRWGDRTDGGGFVRNSGIMLHAVPEDGTSRNTWTSSIECQLAQGCVGDLILIRGRGADDREFPARFTTEVEVAPDGKRHRWKKGGESKSFPPARGQLWWNQHDWDFDERLDGRGRHDVESPLGEWTRVECTCAADQITVRVNGTVVNQCQRTVPAEGRILLQSEGFELFVRKFELHPLPE